METPLHGAIIHPVLLKRLKDVCREEGNVRCHLQKTDDGISHDITCAI